MNLRLLKIFKDNLDEKSANFLASVFLGRRELLKQEEKSIFVNAGIAHLLAISGSNIALSGVVVFFILGLFGVRYRPRLLISMAFLLLYMLITGANPPVVRAVIMYAAIGAGFFLKRKVSALNSFGLAGLACLLYEPYWLHDASFQLSFLSIAALIIGFKVYSPKSQKSELLNSLRYLFFSSLFVTIFITPVVSYYFKRVYILSILHNIILVPFFSFILTLCFLLLVFSPCVYLAQAIGALISFCVAIFYALAGSLAKIPFTYVDCAFSKSAIWLYYILLSCLLFFQPFLYSRGRKIVKNNRILTI